MRTRREPLYDINPQIGTGFEVFYSDRTLETFGRGGGGWFWWSRQRGSAPGGAGNRAICCKLRRVSARLREPGAIHSIWGPIWGLALELGKITQLIQHLAIE